MATTTEQGPAFQGPACKAGQYEDQAIVIARHLDLSWIADPDGVKYKMSLIAEEAHGRIQIMVKHNDDFLVKSIVVTDVYDVLKALVIKHQKQEQEG